MNRAARSPFRRFAPGLVLARKGRKVSDAAAQAYPRPLYAWYACAVLLLAYIFSFIDRTIVSLLVIPIERDLGINDAGMSLLQGFSFALFYALLGLPIARLVDARDRRVVVAAGIALWSIMTAACGLAGRFWHLFLARVGVGAGEAALLPGATSLLADYFPPERRGLAMGVFAAGIYLGAGLALVIGGLLLHLLDGTRLALPLLGALHPWQTVFIAVGAPGLVVALLMLSLREPERRGGGGAPLHLRSPCLSRHRRPPRCGSSLMKPPADACGRSAVAGSCRPGCGRGSPGGSSR